MVNPFADVNWNPDRAERRKFAVTLIWGMPLVAAVWLVVGRLLMGAWKPGLIWLGVGGQVLGLVLYALPAIAKPVYRVWYFIGSCLGFVMGNVLLTAFYYLAMTPIGFLLRAAGRLSFRKGFDRTCNTYWEQAEKVVDSRDYYRQF